MKKNYFTKNNGNSSILRGIGARLGWLQVLVLSLFTTISVSVYANGGIGYKGIYVNKNGTKTWYKAHNVGWGYNGCDNYQFNSASDFSGQNLGTFSTTDVLQIAGYAVVGWTDNADYVAGKLEYKIWKQGDSEPGSWTVINVGNYQNPGSGVTQVVCSSGSDRVVGYDNGTTNIQPGVAGTYNFKIKGFGRMQYVTGSFNDNNGSEVTATFTITAPASTISGAKIGVNFNGAGDVWRYTGAQDGCDGGSGVWATANLGTMYTTGTLVLSGANMVVSSTSTNAKLQYRVYKQGDSAPSFTAYNLSTETPCGAGKKYENTVDVTVPAASYSTPGTYNFEIYHQADSGSTLYMNNSGSNYIATFVVNDLKPTVAATTIESNDVTDTSFHLASNVTSQGGAAVTERGFVYGTSANPTTSGSKTTSGSGTGAYNVEVTGLTVGTTYYVRSYAINSAGTSYGTETTITTLGAPTGGLATSPSPKAMNVSWTKFSGDRLGSSTAYSVLVLRNSTNSFTAPTDGVIYTVGQTIGTGGSAATVEYYGSGTSFSDVLDSSGTYYYALYSEGYTYYSPAAVISGTAVAVAPTIEATVAMDQISGTSARSLSNSITDDGGAAVTGRGLVYHTSANPTLANSVAVEGAGTGNFTTSISGLTPGTQYYVRAYATNSAGTSYGAQVYFHALNSPSNFTATSNSQTSINLTWDKFTGQRNGTSTTYDVMVVRSLDASFTAPTNGTSYVQGGSIGGDQIVYKGSATSFENTGLTTGVTYYYAIYSEGWNYYSPAATDDAVPQSVNVTLAATAINNNIVGRNYASIASNITDNGGASVTERGVVVGTSPNPTTADTKFTNGTGNGTYNTNVTGLTSGTQYYARSYAINSVGTSYGTQVSFQTLLPPTTLSATAASASQINLSWIKWSGDRAGSSTAYDVIVVRSTDASFTAPTDGVTYTDASSIGGDQVIYVGTNTSFSDTGLSTSTQYYYAIYSVGWTYYSSSRTANATTLAASAPTVSSTDNATSVTKNSATFSGTISSDGGVTITDRGFVFSTDSTPTFENGVKVSEGGTTTGSFSTGTGTILSSSTTYYVRAYATNSVGTSYGPVAGSSFTTSAHTARDQILSDRVYFKNGAAAAKSYYCAYNVSDCYGRAQASDGGWNGTNLGVYETGETFKLGAYAMTHGRSNGNACYFNYRIYKEGDAPGSFTSQNMNFLSESCDEDGINDAHGNSGDKAWEWPTSDITIPSSTGTYIIECYFERNPDSLNNDGNNYKAFITVEKPDGIFSGKVALRKNEDAVVWYNANADTDCDPGSSIDLHQLNNVITSSDYYTFGANLISTVVLTNPKLHYVMYPVGGRPDSPVFQSIDLTVATTPCSAFKYQSTSTSNQLFTAGTYTSGQYVLETYFSGVNGTTYYNRVNDTDNFITYFSINDPNDGNLNPTGTNISGIYESYIGQLILGYDEAGEADPNDRIISKVYDLDGNYASSNNINFDLGSTPPGISFRVGMEAKVFTKGTHKACGCSSWYYLYEDGVDSDPVEGDFPLPEAASQTILYSQQWGKFTLMNSSMDWGNNDVFFNPSGETNGFSTSTPDGTYNGQLGASATYTKFKDFLDLNAYGGTYEPAATNMAVTDPVNEVECPTCDGDYRVAVAFICWVNTDNTKKCPGESGYSGSTDGATLIYHRDINQNKIYNGVYLNPRHPNSPYFSGNKNSFAGTEVFYVSKISISSSADESNFGGSWDVTPSRVRDANINASYDTGTTGSFLCNNLKLATGTTLTIRTGDYVEVLNRAQTFGTAKIVVEKGGHFVQRCDKKASEAHIEHDHSTRNLAYQDYAYWSSPIQEDIVPTLAAAGMSRMYYWDQANRWKTMTNSSAAGIGLGRGFIAWNGDESTPGAGKALAPTFTGTATNGIVNVAVTKADDDASNSLNFALLGNPYACALNGEEFLLANNPNIAGAYYVWTSNTRLAERDYAGSSDNTKNYNPADYATYNLTAGVGTAASASIEGGIGNSGAPTKYIASGQGFFVQALADATVVFKNFMRSTTGNTETLFRGKKSAKKSRIWININDGDGGFKQMAVGYVGGASPEYDPFFDAEMVTNSNVKIYSILEDKNLTIQGRPYWHVNSDESIPVGIYSKQETELEVSIDHFDGEFEYKEVYLEDKDLGVMHNLKDSSYRFSTTSGEYNDRFVLHFKSVVPVREEAEGNESDLIKSNLIVSTNSDGVELVNDDYKITKVEVYNILGSKIYNKLFVPANKINLTELKSQNHVVIVKVTYEDGYKETRKVLY